MEDVPILERSDPGGTESVPAEPLVSTNYQESVRGFRVWFALRRRRDCENMSGRTPTKGGISFVSPDDFIEKASEGEEGGVLSDAGKE